MNKYYLAGYYLIKTKPINFGQDKGKIVYTCSRCINLTLFDNWCSSWMNDQLNQEEIDELDINAEIVKEIQKWTDKRFEFGSNIFPDFQTAIEFKNRFFNSIKNINVLGLYFDENEANLFLNEFAKGKNVDKFNFNSGNFPMKIYLDERKEELIENDDEELIGYDMVGVECDGSLHTIYCQNLTNTIVDKFNLEVNNFGLFDKPNSTKEITKFLNDPRNGLEPIPWYTVKIKRNKLASS